MKMSYLAIKKILILTIVSVVVMTTSMAVALTPKEQKGVRTLMSPNLEYTSPDWLRPASLRNAPIDIDHWMNVLPYPQDRWQQTYLVIPTLGIVVPVQYIPPGTNDFDRMIQGRNIDLNTYLQDGILHYPMSAWVAQEGNMVLFGHSNYFLNKPGRYRAIFADLMALDAGIDELWLYDRLSDGTYTRYVFDIEASYETTPDDVNILLPQWGIELTVFACTDGVRGRRIVRSRLRGTTRPVVEPASSYPQSYPEESLPSPQAPSSSAAPTPPTTAQPQNPQPTNPQPTGSAQTEEIYSDIGATLQVVHVLRVRNIFEKVRNLSPAQQEEFYQQALHIIESRFPTQWLFTSEETAYKITFLMFVSEQITTYQASL